MTTTDPGLPFRARGEAAAEATRLCAGGLLRRIAVDVFVAADVPDAPALRARAVRLLVPGRLLAAGGVVGFTSAAWVHTGWHPGAPPERIEVLVPPGANRYGGPGVRVRQVRVGGADVVLLAELPLTAPARTAADLARDSPWPVARAGLAALAAGAGIGAGDVLACLDRMRRARGAARARQVVARWAGTGRPGTDDRDDVRDDVRGDVGDDDPDGVRGGDQGQESLRRPVSR